MVLKGKTKITFHSGILTIGGTVIEIAYQDSHIFFDFGTEFRPELTLPDEQLQTLVDNGLVPNLNHVYDPRLNYLYQGNDDQTYRHTAVFLSHVHLDHSKMINYLDPAIPLYTLKESKDILNFLNREGDFLLPSPFEDKHVTRPMIGLEKNAMVQIGEIQVEIVPVDHDAYGASALLIRTPDAFLTYTGDLRLHGHNSEDTKRFCEKAKHTDVLMMEGVSISFPERVDDPTQIKILSEEDLIQQIVALVLANPHRQITFNGYPANILRFAKLIDASPREVVLEAKMAALILEVLGKQVPYYYLPSEQTIQQLDTQLEVSYESLLMDSSEYLFQVVEGFDKLMPQGLYIHSDAQPLGDFDPSYQVFLEMLAKQQIEFVRLACSGHAFPNDLKQIIAWIEPKCLVPIHTLHPEKLENPYGERILPHRGETLTL